MNRVLFDENEVGADGHVSVTGRRAEHISKVLKAQVGGSIRVGILDGALGVGEIFSVNHQIVEIVCEFEPNLPPSPNIDILLALPRPKVMRRLWAQLSSLGVGHIVLTNAEKVDKNYFATHWLNEDTYRPRLIEGLEQSGDTLVPKVSVVKSFKPFVEILFDGFFPDTRRLVCHPRNAVSIGEIDLKESQRTMLAIGPEGGWTDYEVDLLGQHGFECVSLGWRTLRSDVAAVALVSAVNALSS